jgi:hypothetical protein
MRIIPILLAVTLCACSSQPPANQQRTSNDPDADSPEIASMQDAGAWLQHQFDAFVFDLMDGQLLVTKKNSRISVPANAFVRKNGTAPKGKVRLVFREYQTNGEIMASGLPMKYVEPNGDTIQFESAGMFEIRAYEGKEELDLKQGKEISVELATPSDGAYNFYLLDDNTRAWSEQAKNLRAMPNAYRFEEEQRLKELEAAAAEKPKALVPYQPSDRIFDIRVDPRTYPEFDEMGGVMWKYVGTNAKQDPANNPKTFHEKYAYMRLTPKAGDAMIYEVEFTSEKDTITLDLAPVFQGKLKDRNEKRFREKITAFNEALREQERIRSQYRNEAKLLRQFNVDKLGIYNYDRQLKEENVVPVQVEFTFAGRPHTDYPQASVYLIPKGKLAVIQYTRETAHDFALNPYGKNQLIAVIGEGEVYALSSEQINGLDLARSKGKHKIIDLKKFGKPARTGSDIDQILAKL